MLIVKVNANRHITKNFRSCERIEIMSEVIVIVVVQLVVKLAIKLVN